MPFGSQLKWPYYRPVISDAEATEMHPFSSGAQLVFCLLVGLAVVMALTCGPVLPMWMFFNSLQLIAHLPLLQVKIPATANLLLLELLAIVRLHIFDFHRVAAGLFLDDANSDAELEDMIQTRRSSSYNELFLACGYRSSLVRNLAPILIILAVALALWVLLGVRDLVCRRHRHEPTGFNAVMRVWYEGFFEVALCLCMGYSTVSSLAVCLAVLVAATLGLLCLLCFRLGPYTKDSYEPRSLFASFWGLRPLQSQWLAEVVSEEEKAPKKIDP